MSNTTPQPPATNAAPPGASATPATAAPEAAKEGESKKDAAKAAATAAAKNAAKAGLAVFNKFKGGFAGGAKGLLSALLAFPLLLIRGELSTKILFVGFLTSVVLLVMSGAQLYHRFVEPHMKKSVQKSEAGESINEFFRQQKALNIAAANVVFLEKFTGSVTSKTSRATTFDVEVVAEAAVPEASRYMKNNMTKVREVVGMAIHQIDYEELLTEEGKLKLRKEIVEELNKAFKKWKAPGSVKRVYFINFVMG